MTTMTARRWLTVNAAAKLIGGLDVYEVEALADFGVLSIRSLDLCHRSVSEESVTALMSASECPSDTADAVAEHVDTPTVGGGPDIGEEAEELYRLSKEDL